MGTELTKQAEDPAAAVRRARMHLQALNGQHALVGTLYQLSGEYAALCERLLALAEQLARAPEAPRAPAPPEPPPV